MSQSQRQLLKPMAPIVHRKPVGGSGSISSIGSERSGNGSGNGPVVDGLGSNRENDAVLLASGGFNNLIPEPVNAMPGSAGSQSKNGSGNGAGGFDFNHYERPSGYQDRGHSPANIDPNSNSNERIRKDSTINMGAMGMGAVLKREIASGTPTIVEPEVGGHYGKGFGHRYQRSERVVLES